MTGLRIPAYKQEFRRNICRKAEIAAKLHQFARSGLNLGLRRPKSCIFAGLMRSVQCSANKTVILQDFLPGCVREMRSNTLRPVRQPRCGICRRFVRVHPWQIAPEVGSSSPRHRGPLPSRVTGTAKPSHGRSGRKPCRTGRAYSGTRRESCPRAGQAEEKEGPSSP